MSQLVDPEESAALADAARGGGAAGTSRVAVVTPRDFKEPRTLSADRVARIRKTLSARLQVIANTLAGPLRGHPTLQLGEVSEVNAQGLFDGFVRPFLVHGFQCAGGQGWVIWETEAGRIVCDTILSSPPQPVDPEAEPIPAGEPMLTRTERRVVGALLDELLERVATEFGLVAEPGTIWQEPEELTTMEDLGPDGDARRLYIHLGFETETGYASDIRIYLPGIAAATEHTDESARVEAPAHLASMEMEVSVNIGSTEVPLAELLSMEVGDVIPLDARVGDLAEIEIEETVYARGRCGSHQGLLALRVEEITKDSRPLPSPTDNAPAGKSPR